MKGDYGQIGDAMLCVGLKGVLLAFLTCHSNQEDLQII